MHRHSCSSMSERFNIITDALYSQGNHNSNPYSKILLLSHASFAHTPPSFSRPCTADGLYRSPADAFKAINQSCVRFLLLLQLPMMMTFVQLRAIRHRGAHCAAGGCHLQHLPSHVPPNICSDHHKHDRPRRHMFMLLWYHRSQLREIRTVHDA